MANKKIDEGCLKIIRHYGLQHQKRKLAEEFVELIEAITACQFSKRGGLFENMVEEIADVSVVLRQVQKHFSISDEKVEEIMLQKIQRTIERMDTDKG